MFYFFHNSILFLKSSRVNEIEKKNNVYVIIITVYCSHLGGVGFSYCELISDEH